MHTTRMIRAGLSLALVSTLAACGEDTLLNPNFGAGCLRGSLSAGQTVEGAFSENSCRQEYHFFAEGAVPYEGWTVHLTAGQAYMITLQKQADPDQEGLNNVDPLLTLWGKDRNGTDRPLAVSDDDGGGFDGLDSEFWFVAPRSGTYTLVASSLGWDEFGGYRLSMQSCPVLGTLDTTGTYTFPSPISPCVRHANPTDTDRPLMYSFLRVPMDSVEDVSVSIEHDNSYPVWELGGLDFDTNAEIYEESDNSYNDGNGSTNYFSTYDVGGMVTAAVGTYAFGAPGVYTVEFDRSGSGSTAPRPPADGRLTVRSAFGGKKPARR